MPHGRTEPQTLFNWIEDEALKAENLPSKPPSSTLGPWETNKVHNIDCLNGLRQMRENCVDVAVTSPPYWGQRGNGGLGLEEDPRDYVRHLTEVLAEVMRCLKPSGTLWLNLGDSYNTPINWRVEDYSHSSLGATAPVFRRRTPLIPRTAAEDVHVCSLRQNGCNMATCLRSPIAS